jgi:hypothetical protein
MHVARCLLVRLLTHQSNGVAFLDECHAFRCSRRIQCIGGMTEDALRFADDMAEPEEQQAG